MIPNHALQRSGCNPRVPSTLRSAATEDGWAGSLTYIGSLGRHKTRCWGILLCQILLRL
jgi:hypothetical protein